jgi:hypothetical protein
VLLLDASHFARALPLTRHAGDGRNDTQLPNSLEQRAARTTSRID